MRNQSYTYYNLHLIISRFGNKLTSMVLVFYFMNLFPDKSLFLTVLLFSISNLPSIIFSSFFYSIYFQRLLQIFFKELITHYFSLSLEIM